MTKRKTKPEPKKPPPAPAPAAPARVVNRRADVAAHFGVSNRTIGYWQENGMPHGPGLYDLEAIDAWLKQTGIQRESNGSTRENILKAELKIKRVKLSRLRGELVEVEAVRRLIIRHVNEAKAILDQIPARVAANLTGATKALRARVRKTAQAAVRDACQSLADSLEAPEIESRESREKS